MSDDKILTIIFVNDSGEELIERYEVSSYPQAWRVFEERVYKNQPLFVKKAYVRSEKYPK